MEHHVCPWYIGYLLANPLRKLYQDPGKLLRPYVKTGMTVLEVGPGMGFFSIPMARLVGEKGKIYSVDLQERMLQTLRKRAAKKNVQHTIEARRCSESSLEVKDLSGSIDFALAFAVVHEIPDTQNLFKEICNALRQGGILLVSEPRDHVSREAFEKYRSIAEQAGFAVSETPAIRGSLSVVLKKV
ncbi:MAG: methyltransferase domain-containing protein [Bacteroidota bacterium]